MASQMRCIVVSGATGKQGGALISALLSLPTPSFEIYALTRDTKSKSAVALASKPNVTVVEGDFSNPAAIFAKIPSPWGFFSVTTAMNAKKEEENGKAMTAAALAAGVRHIVFTATDRGAQSDTNPTKIPHFASKFNIEKDIVEKSAQRGTTYTFLRPVAFLENLTNDFFGRAFISMWRLNGKDSRLKLISTRDIGRVAAEAFLHHDDPAYQNQAIALAGADISLSEAQALFKEETGQDLSETYSTVARGLKWAMHEQLGIMFNWFKTDGFGVNVADIRKRYPFLKDFRTWLRTESAWRSQ